MEFENDETSNLNQVAKNEDASAHRRYDEVTGFVTRLHSKLNPCGTKNLAVDSSDGLITHLWSSTFVGIFLRNKYVETRN